MKNSKDVLLDQQAFPCGTENFHYSGMTLLDYFAGQAMIGIIMHPNTGFTSIPMTIIAKDSYDMAELMLLEREKRMK